MWLVCVLGTRQYSGLRPCRPPRDAYEHYRSCGSRGWGRGLLVWVRGTGQGDGRHVPAVRLTEGRVLAPQVVRGRGGKVVRDVY